MQVTAISAINSNTNNYNPQFQANFSEAQLKTLVAAAKRSEGVYGLPKLYTLLEYMNELPGMVAKIVTRKGSKVLSIDGKKVFSTHDYVNNFGVLKDFLTGERYPNDTFIRMPQSVFESQWWRKRSCREKSIYRFALPKKAAKPDVNSVKTSSRSAKAISVPPEPKIAALETQIENIKPYSVVKEIYRDKKGKRVLISNIDILSKSKTAEGIAELDSMEKNMNSTFKPVFAQKRKAIALEIKKQSERPEIYGNK